MTDSPKVCLKDLERHASRTLTPAHWGYISTGSGAGCTQLRNENNFRDFLIRPRVLCSVGTPDLTTSLLGQNVSMPICVGAFGWNGLAHEKAEVATASAAYKSDTLYCMPTLRTTTIQDVAAANSTGIRWFQLYVLSSSRDDITRLVREAEEFGFTAVILTIDAPTSGIRYADIRSNFSVPSHLDYSVSFRGEASYKDVAKSGGNIGWEFVDWLISVTKLPVVLKGISTPEDAILAVKHGVSAVWVSNHGGRLLDGTPGSLDLLCDVMKGLQSIDSKIEVYMDGGVRYGTDVLKAIYLGARAVFLGQPIFWGLSYKEEEGVTLVLELLRRELRLAMTLSGCKSVHELPNGLIVHRSEYLSSKL